MTTHRILYQPLIRIAYVFLFVFIIACNSFMKKEQQEADKPYTYTNHLVTETSPYLLQHAHNPVNWYAWNDEALEKAKKENKLLLISIGYSACHWCHVMEHESFEDDTVAKIMNDHFVCIKVDREERPDIDQVYMQAVQLMTGSGGWPLNCFTLPDGRPIYGGTYFPKKQWMNILFNLADVYKNDPEKVYQYAEELTEGIKKTELVKLNTEKPDFNIDILHTTCTNWSKNFDTIEGGPNRAPKFPLPNNYQFLLRYYYLSSSLSKGERETLLKHINLTLDKMAYGGIYDQVGGGFSRYSTDSYWKVPHFEKMLYDNAQLVSLYSEAYQLTKNYLYKQVVYETLEFIRREMTSPEQAFYSSIDADSEKEEGKYYVWKKEELQQILENDLPGGFNLFADYYNVNREGLWEDDNYILLRKTPDEEIAKQYKLSVDELRTKIKELKKQVLSVREKRVKPGLDNKILTSWNTLMIKGYTDAYNVFNEPAFLQSAIGNADFILTKLRRSDGGLYHTSPGSAIEGKGPRPINGYLEDYSFTIEALIALYQSTFDEKWLITAKSLMEYTIQHFYNTESKMFWFTSDLDTGLIVRKMEITDNVIPSSNSSIAKSLFMLGHYFDANEYISMSRQMLNNVKNDISSYGSGYSNWAMLMLNFVSPFYEVAIVGNSVNEKRKQFNEHYLPNRIFAGSKTQSQLPLLEDKYVEGKTMIYVCENKSCQLPVENPEEALKQMRK